MTHEADTTNFSMSLVDDAAEAAFAASANTAKTSDKRDQLKTDLELRMSFGRWSIRDKLEWECLTCTFLNEPLFLTCDMCGHARPRQDDTGRSVGPGVEGTGVQQSGNDEGDILTAEERRDLQLQDDEERIRQERIKEIMALQQGIFNKIKEETVEEAAGLDDPTSSSSNHELESSFAWMDLEDPLPLKDLPSFTTTSPAATATNAATAAADVVTCTSATATAAAAASASRASYPGFKKKPTPDESGSTLATVGSSCSQLSAQFSDRFSVRSLDISDSSHHSYQSRRSACQNAPLPEFNLSSLKSDESFGGSLRRANINKGSNRTPPASAAGAQAAAAAAAGLVDFGALKASVDGNSARDLDFLMSQEVTGTSTAGSPASVGLDSVGGSTHSMGSFRTLETPEKVTRRTGLMSPVSSLAAVFEVSKEISDSSQSLSQNSEAELMAGPPVPAVTTTTATKPDPYRRATSTPLPPVVGAVQVPASRSLLRRSLQEKSQDDSSKPVGAVAMDGLPDLKAYNKEVQEKITASEGFKPAPAEPEIALAPQGEEGPPPHEAPPLTMMRRDGARKIPPSSLISPERKAALRSGNDPVFSRNLYADKKVNNRSMSPMAKKKSDKPGILGRLLRKKPQQS